MSGGLLLVSLFLGAGRQLVARPGPAGVLQLLLLLLILCSVVSVEEEEEEEEDESGWECECKGGCESAV